MGTATQLPLAPSDPASVPAAVDGETSSSQALVAVPPQPAENAEDASELTGPLALLPVEVDVTVPVRNFRVRNLLTLEPGHVIESQWSNGDDLPLNAHDVQLAWTEFEVVENDLAVRITRLS
jgi:flagellar motor switch protein FliN/FliY